MARFRVVLRNIFVDRKETEVQAQPIMRRVLRKITRSTAEKAREKAPVKTGGLKASIREDTDHQRTPMSVEGGVSADKPYAIYQELGTGLHGPRRAKYPIRAVNAESLRFFWPRTGRVERFKSVMHPGVKPRHFMRDALYDAVAEDDDIKP
jgi:HK97 gp10 family phage protein